MKRYHIIVMGILCLVTTSSPQMLEAQESGLNIPEIGILVHARVHNSIHIEVDVFVQPLASLGRMELIPGYIINFTSSQQTMLMHPTRWITVPCVQAIRMADSSEITSSNSFSSTTCGIIRGKSEINRFTFVSMGI